MHAFPILIILSVAACNSVRDREVTVDNTDQVLQEIGQSRDLTPEEAQLVTAYVVRHSLGLTLGVASDATLPATVGDIIDSQRAFVAQLEAQERERAAAPSASNCAPGRRFDQASRMALSVREETQKRSTGWRHVDC